MIMYHLIFTHQIAFLYEFILLEGYLGFNLLPSFIWIAKLEQNIKANTGVTFLVFAECLFTEVILLTKDLP